ncbi:NAD(P)HX epimerase / ADP-dependent (S)-NAD(P)H-hydrate dehydratase 2 [Pectobacterium sp. F1-1]|nr:NAD(P)HX epimerase / ADP-dependent (S)-NAD(P)H-hydrate dehydratase 2 [Pectobacterium sp. F1-1]
MHHATEPYRLDTAETTLPDSVFYAEWVRREEARAARESGLSLWVLMQRAGDAAF